MKDNEIIKALDRLEKTKDYLRELYREQVKRGVFNKQPLPISAHMY